MTKKNILKKYNLELKTYNIAGLSIKLYQTENVDSIVDFLSNEQYQKDERFPFFLNIWESGERLSEYLIAGEIELSDKKLLELGSGSGIVGITCGLKKAKIIFSDYEEDALTLCKINARLNGLKNFSLLQADWRSFPKIELPIDYIICADLLYEQRQVKPLKQTITNLLTKDAICYLADPGRNYINTFIEQLIEDGLKVQLLKEYPNKTTSLRNIKIYKINR